MTKWENPYVMFIKSHHSRLLKCGFYFSDLANYFAHRRLHEHDRKDDGGGDGFCREWTQQSLPQRSVLRHGDPQVAEVSEQRRGIIDV